MRSACPPARPLARPLARPAAAGLAALLAAAPARAQLVGRYLNPLEPGLGAEPGVTVASRLHPEYDYRGVRVGGVLVSPELVVSPGYDSNVTGTRPARGSALVQTSGSVSATSAGSAATVSAALTADDFRYTDIGNQSYTNWTAALRGAVALGRDQASFGYSHLNLNQTPRDLDAPLLSRPIAFRVDDVTLGYRANFARAYLRPNLEVANYGFDNGTAAGAPYPQTYRDRVVVSPGVEAGYEVAPRRALVLVLRDATAGYTGRLAGQPSRDFDDLSALAGVAYDVDGVVVLRLLAGYEARLFRSAARKAIQAPVVEASASWTPSGLTTVTASAARYIEDAASEAVVGLTETALRLGVDHEYLRNVVLSASAAWLRDEYQQNGGQQSLYEAALGATWLLNRNLRLGATYQFYSRQSGDVVGLSAAGLGPGFGPLGLATAGTYAEHRVLFQLRLGL